MSISAKEVKALRDRTGAGMMDCKKALQETGGDLEAAIDLLRATGVAKAAKRSGKSANEGTIGFYVHFDNRTAVIVELNCETDFVANTEDFQQLARNIALHVASQAPLAVSPDDIPEETIARERKVYREQVKEAGKHTFIDKVKVRLSNQIINNHLHLLPVLLQRKPHELDPTAWLI